MFISSTPHTHFKAITQAYLVQNRQSLLKAVQTALPGCQILESSLREGEKNQARWPFIVVTDDQTTPDYDETEQVFLQQVGSLSEAPAELQQHSFAIVK